ncbi:hypothetical protein DLP05_126 [Stenotrophomonas phage vB_SmaS_DLP_5]|uniref:Uncharacterized protein n=1 Tax=Stenotrophomonas phage vB_SmaS_DLP_5 TaxID=2044561 RepID=A0A2D2W2V6_9CAUD|nr:hypothetical protein FDJ07_gp095 [Stenotrophomonas phage vB_SmaS_DLP_5]ATS92316.1 hypothetical protein DLP05_126 [Stenotrophomonas phage vB_SmaS_DLP_5]
MKNYEEPTVTFKEGPTGGEEIRHPAFGKIWASRTNGRENLYGSNVGHDGYITLRIDESYMVRDGYSEHMFGGHHIIEVMLSEAQWVGLISRMNHGDGIPCTLSYRPQGQMMKVPRLPEPKKAVEKMEGMIDSMTEEHEKQAKASAAQLWELIEKRFPKSLHHDARIMLDRVVGQGKSTREFQKDRLTKVKERLVNESKVEIDAMLTNAISNLGVASIEQLGQILSANPEAAMQLIAHDKKDSQE